MASVLDAKHLSKRLEVFSTYIDPYAPDKRIRLIFDRNFHASANQEPFVINDACVGIQRDSFLAIFLGNPIVDGWCICTERRNAVVCFAATLAEEAEAHCSGAQRPVNPEPR